MMFSGVIGGAAGGGADDSWRLYFPDGSVQFGEGAMFIQEAEFYEADGSTNLATGGAASASRSDPQALPAEAFDGDLGTAWGENGGMAPSWLQYDFTSAVEVGDFRIAYSSNGEAWGPGTINLQRDDNGAWPTIQTYTVPAWLDADNILFKQDGRMIPQTFKSTTSTTISSSSFASKGMIYNSLVDILLDAVSSYIGPSGTETYKVVVAEVDPSDDTIASILGESGSESVSSTGLQEFTFTSAVTIPTGRFAIILVRTDGGPTSIARPAFPGGSLGADGARFSPYAYVRYASINPTVGDSVNNGTNNVVRLEFDYWFT